MPFFTPNLAAVLVSAVLVVSADVSAQRLRFPAEDVSAAGLLSFDPPVYSESRGRGGLPAWRGGRFSVWLGIRVSDGPVCGEFDSAGYGSAALRPWWPLPFGAVGGRDPLTCSQSAGFDGGFAGLGVIERIMTVEEAHGRGLCVRSDAVKRLFALDGANVFPAPVAEPVLRSRRTSRRVWLPPLNQCWFVWQRVRLHQRWNLAMPAAEAAVYRGVLGGCSPSVLEVPSCPASQPPSGGW